MVLPLELGFSSQPLLRSIWRPLDDWSLCKLPLLWLLDFGGKEPPFCNNSQLIKYIPLALESSAV